MTVVRNLACVSTIAFSFTLMVLLAHATAGHAQVRFLEEEARKGSPVAQNKLGRMYLFGKGVPKSPQEAAKLFRESADKGFPRSAYDLGLLYEQGLGVPENRREAYRWFLKAANRGYSRAQYKLGDLYREGVGVPKDDVQAYKWYNLAAAQGDDQAAGARRRLARQMTPDQIAEAQKLSVEFAPQN